MTLIDPTHPAVVAAAAECGGVPYSASSFSCNYDNVQIAITVVDPCKVQGGYSMITRTFIWMDVDEALAHEVDSSGSRSRFEEAWVD